MRLRDNDSLIGLFTGIDKLKLYSILVYINACSWGKGYIFLVLV
jgi:hypothetical protein